MENNENLEHGGGVNVVVSQEKTSVVDTKQNPSKEHPFPHSLWTKTKPYCYQNLSRSWSNSFHHIITHKKPPETSNVKERKTKTKTKTKTKNFKTEKEKDLPSKTPIHEAPWSSNSFHFPQFHSITKQYPQSNGIHSQTSWKKRKIFTWGFFAPSLIFFTFCLLLLLRRHYSKEVEEPPLGYPPYSMNPQRLSPKLFFLIFSWFFPL